MNVESGQQPTSLTSQASVSQNQNSLDFGAFGFNASDFDTWAAQVRRQMIASLKKRTVIYGDFWGNEARAASAKAAEDAAKPERDAQPD